MGAEIAGATLAAASWLRVLGCRSQKDYEVSQTINGPWRKMRTSICIAGLIMFVAGTLQTIAQTKPSADLIISNAKIWTVDKSNPTAQAVAVLGDRIVAVGSNSDVDTWRGPKTRVIDAEAKLLLPGINDAHVHFVSGGLALDEVQLNDASSAEEFVH